MTMSLSCLHQPISSSRSLYCNVPDPPTDEEDATMALTIRATSPMNMCIHKNIEMLKTKFFELEHAYVIIYHTQRKKHTFIQAFIQHVHHNH